MTNSINDMSMGARSLGPALNRVGRYRLIALIGRGGMADVYLAVAGGETTRFRKLLVVKILKPEFCAEREFIEMFIDEARLAARLSHPNVIPTLEVGEDSGRHFLAMEYLEGQSLSRVLQSLDSVREFDLSMRLTVVLRALAGLDYAHELTDYDGTPLNVVHRDVSPGNILVGYDGQIKLTDFGIAKASDSTTETRVGVLKGKTAYMAPEQAMAGTVDRRADIYSAGVIIWELIVGRRMWQGFTPAEILSRVLAGDIPAPSRLTRDVPPALEHICLKALSLNKEDRYPTAAALAQDLEAFLSEAHLLRTDREIGRLVAEAFRGERAQLRELIERQLAPGAPGEEFSLPLPIGEGSLSTRLDEASRLSASALQSLSTRSQAPADPVSSRLGERDRRAWQIVAAVAGVLGVVFMGGIAMRMQRAEQAVAAPALSQAVLAASPPVPVVQQQGVSTTEIALGMSAVFSGPSRQLGENMKLGLDTAFFLANREGGIHGRKISLVALDDGYEAARVPATMKELLDQRQVFAVIGNVGTPTSVVAAPLAVQHKAVFFGAFTGAPVVRQDPPDRYVFNYRASYREETAASVRYLVEVQKIPVEQIVVFAQDDSFGDAGFDGVSKAVRQLSHGGHDVLRVGYKRNTTDVEEAVAQIVKYNDRAETIHVAGSLEPKKVLRHPVKAVVMVATYRAASKFIQKMHDVQRFGPQLFFNVSFVGTEALADDLKSINPGLCSGVYVTQVVPPFDSGATGVRRYRDALSQFQPQAQPGFVSLEGFIVGSAFVEALKRTGPELTTEKLVDTLEQFDGIDLGFGTKLSYSLSEHQASHKVWGTRLDKDCTCQTADLE